MLKITSKGRPRAHSTSFEVIENAGAGDCLYLSGLDFMRRHKSSFNNIPADVVEFRSRIVDYVFSRNAIGFQSNWDRFANSFLYNLHHSLPILLDNDATKADRKKDAYKEYTLKLGNDGTMTELTLMAEMFGFSCRVVRKINDSDFNCFDPCSNGKVDLQGEKPTFFVYFTGSLTAGHFRHLRPLKPTKLTAFETGNYSVSNATDDDNLISISNCVTKSNEPPPVPASGSDLISCPHCHGDQRKSFKGERGLKIHISRKHPDLIPSSNSTFVDFASIGEQLAQLKARTRLLLRIPKAARKIIAEKLSETINNVVKHNDTNSWNELFLFAYKTMRVPERTEKSLVSSIKQILSAFELPKSAQSSSNKPQLLNKRVEAKLADYDIRGAVKILSSEETLATFDDATFKELTKKHPAPSRDLNIPTAKVDAEFCLVVSQKNIKHGIASFSHGSAPGLDGIRPQHIKDLTSFSAGDAGARLLTSITNLSNLMLRGEVEKEVCSILYGAALCALNKKSGGIRPIAIGNFFRRLTAKVGCFQVRDASAKFLGPHQMGVGIRKGAEAIIHATRSWVNSLENQNKILVKIDYINAFNSTERDSMLTEIKKQTPSLFPFLHQCYSTPSTLYFGDKSLQSQVGAQQGDPAGSLAFSLAIQPIVEEITTDLNAWYLDDGTIGDSHELVLENFISIIERSKSLGLKINPSKCELFFCSGIVNDEIVAKFNRISPGIKVIDHSTFTLLGSPIFDEGFETSAAEKLSSLRRMTSKLINLNPHVAYFLLKNCFAIPKLTYFLRTCTSWKFPDFLNAFDTEIRQCLENILNLNLDDKQWIQSSLPIGRGGIGIRRAHDISIPAFLASAFGARFLVANILHSSGNNISIHHMDEALSVWQSLNGTDLPTAPDSQKNWDLLNIERIIREDLHFNSTKDIARFTALQAPESGKWLHSIPISHNDTLLDGNTIRICIGLRLGGRICHKYTCRCGADVLEDGTHGLSCTINITKYFRHSEFNNILHRALSSINVPSTLEPPGIFRNDGLTLIPWSRGKNLLWDATCLDTLASSYISKTSIRAGAAAELGSKLKHKKYSELKSSNYIFVPVAVETLGPWAKEAKDFIDTIGSRLNVLTGSNIASNFLCQRISLAIQRYNASCIMETLPPTVPLDEVFYVLNKRPIEKSI